MKFYKETNFQETQIGKIPKDWKIGGASFFDVLKGFAFSSEFFNDDRDGIPLIRIRDLGKTETECYYSGPYDPTYLVRKGDILISMDGEFNVYLWNGPDCLLNQRVCKVWSKDTTKLSDLFLYYVLQRPLKIIESQTSQTTVKHLLDRDLDRIKIPLPPIEEQRAIAEVLGVVDSAVELVDEAIAQVERLKKGLMQQLLTKGIGHKEFKEDPEIGKIPKGWNVLALEDFCEVTDGSHWSPKEVEKSNYKIATVANLRETYIDIDSCKSISEEDYQRLVKEGDVPRKNDILFSKDGTVGICFVFKQQENNIGLLSSIAIITPNHKVLNSEFGAYTLKSPNVFWQIVGKKTGTALRRITLENLKKVKIPIPPMPEQQRIAETLSSVDTILRLKRERKQKLSKMRKRLVDLLLTGKVRVVV